MTTEISKDEINKNIEDRYLFEIVCEEGGDRFWEMCRQRLQPEIEKLDTSRMCDVEVQEFGSKALHFGCVSWRADS